MYNVGFSRGIPKAEVVALGRSFKKGNKNPYAYGFLNQIDINSTWDLQRRLDDAEIKYFGSIVTAGSCTRRIIFWQSF